MNLLKKKKTLSTICFFVCSICSWTRASEDSASDCFSFSSDNSDARISNLACWSLSWVDQGASACCWPINFSLSAATWSLNDSISCSSAASEALTLSLHWFAALLSPGTDWSSSVTFSCSSWSFSLSYQLKKKRRSFFVTIGQGSIRIGECSNGFYLLESVLGWFERLLLVL